MAVKDLTVAVSSDFFEAFARIPQKQQTKVLNFVNKFRTDPTMPGINYEKVHAFKDQNLRSVRVDDTYRGIVLKPQTGNVYMLLWVDQHDQAYDWAKNRVCQISPATGGIQIFQVQEDVVRYAPRAEETHSLFEAFRDKDLLRLGVPKDLLSVVRSLQTPDDLMAQTESFPKDVVEALLWLAEGESIEDVSSTLQALKSAADIDTDDFAAALESPFSKQQFFVDPSELELNAMLGAPLEKWRVFLHPSQRALVGRTWNGPVRVLGGAGTGKTVVAMHRANWLAQNAFSNENDRILFTTFTRNLAADIQENLKSIASPSVLSRIEVINLDRWVNRFLKYNGYDLEIDYSSKTKELWDRAMTLSSDALQLSDDFYRSEWEQIIQAQEIRTFNQYMIAPRTGRGTRLGRKERKEIWPVFEEYILLLDEYKLREPADAMVDARTILQSQNLRPSYRAILVDEAQDMGIQAFKLLRSMLPEGSNDLFIVGDAHQRIYSRSVVLGQCGIKIQGRSRKLRINYRTTEETRRWAVNILRGISIDDLDGGVDGTDFYTSLMHGPQPQINGFADFESETATLANLLQEARKLDGQYRSCCIVTRTNALMEKYETALKAKNIPTYRVKRSEAEECTLEGVRLATMHRVKGLEFDRMFLCGINDGIIPSPFAPVSDQAEGWDYDRRERALLYVAATRAKKSVHISYFGQASRYINR
ncbi:MAG: DNA helicase [Clostridia bacterium]|nr:DNA helicase [Clostridia bacterium]